MKDMFGPGKTVNEYRGELGTVFQRPGDQDVQDTIDWDTREAFVKGHPKPGIPASESSRTPIIGRHIPPSRESDTRNKTSSNTIPASGTFKQLRPKQCSSP